ncbi:histidine phosphatase family protein [Virgibacillus necropolis]|uniref:Histidine phosphatase family protein n=1 Tax=Virgibacillus necropolis TaxID=163877 RepID=A0A221MCN4_9BACI|nr:histidine phosphatase family protein [Virgibacillus necropolis]ASN05436.1 histidine phosphatase family protein [Virgibacillus necropolis]
MIKIGIIRHGCTAWNKEGRAQGNSDIPLDNDGLVEAGKLAERLSEEEEWDIIYSSNLLRANQTAEVIGNRIDIEEINLDPRLREVGGGLIEGTTKKERIEKWGANWRELDLGIESTDKVIERGLSFIDEIIQKHDGKRVLIVSHGSFIKHLLKDLVPHVEESSLKNCSLTKLRKSKGEWELELHNCTRHFDC